MPWHAYRNHFLTAERIDAGVAFWTEHGEAIARISKSSGVAPHVIVGIIGCETFFGRITGKFRVVDALSTLAFDYPPRASYFRARARAVPAARARGRLRHQGRARLLRGRDGQRRSSCRAATAPGRSTATATASATSGAAGPTSSRASRTTSPTTAGAPASRSSRLPASGSRKRTGSSPGKLAPDSTVKALRDRGLAFETTQGATAPALFIRVDGDGGPELRAGFHNFGVITRYNRSILYALAVNDLGRRIEALLPPPAPSQRPRRPPRERDRGPQAARSRSSRSRVARASRCAPRRRPRRAGAVPPASAGEGVPRDEPRAKYGNPPFYEVDGQRYVVLPTRRGLRRAGRCVVVRPGFPRRAHVDRRNLRHARDDRRASDAAAADLGARDEPRERQERRRAPERPRPVRAAAASSTCRARRPRRSTWSGPARRASKSRASRPATPHGRRAGAPPAAYYAQAGAFGSRENAEALAGAAARRRNRGRDRHGRRLERAARCSASAPAPPRPSPSSTRWSSACAPPARMPSASPCNNESPPRREVCLENPARPPACRRFRNRPCRRAAGAAAARARGHVLGPRRPAERPGTRRPPRERRGRAREHHQADDGLRRVPCAAGRQAQARHRGADQRARLAFGRLAHLPRPQLARAGRGADPGHDRAERQRRDDRARRGRRRHRGHLRGADEPVRRAPRHGAEPLPELDGPAGRQPQDVGRWTSRSWRARSSASSRSTTAGIRSASSPGTTSASRTATACSRATRASTA